MNLDAFIEKFNGFTEPYFFYNGEVELRYEPRGHVYYRIIDGEWVVQNGVTTVVHIIDKSDALIPWGCKMMAAKILAEAPISTLPTGERVLPQQAYEDFEKLIIRGKSAHQEKKDEAANIGSLAHNWIEQYIKTLLVNDAAHAIYLRTALWPENERSANCCTAALKWMDRHNVRWRCTERKIYSREYRYAGTMDGLAVVDSCDDPLCCPRPFKDRLSVIDWKSSNYLYLEYLLQTAAYKSAYVEEMQEKVEDIWVIRLGKDDGEFDPWHVEEEHFAEDFDAFLLALELTRAVASITARLKKKAQDIRAEKKVRAQKEREEALKIKCKGADRYKGVRPPRCNGGNPCQSCLVKFQENHGPKAGTEKTSTGTGVDGLRV